MPRLPAPSLPPPNPEDSSSGSGPSRRSRPQDTSTSDLSSNSLASVEAPDGSGNPTSPSPDPSATTLGSELRVGSPDWWKAWWLRASLHQAGSDSSSETLPCITYSSATSGIREHLLPESWGSGQALPPDLDWPLPFRACQETFAAWCRTSGPFDIGLDLHSTWLATVASDMPHGGLVPILVSLPPGFVPQPGEQLLCKRPHDFNPVCIFRLSQVGAFRLSPSQVTQAVWGASRWGAAFLGRPLRWQDPDPEN